LIRPTSQCNRGRRSGVLRLRVRVREDDLEAIPLGDAQGLGQGRWTAPLAALRYPSGLPSRSSMLTNGMLLLSVSPPRRLDECYLQRGLHPLLEEAPAASHAVPARGRQVAWKAGAPPCRDKLIRLSHSVPSGRRGEVGILSNVVTRYVLAVVSSACRVLLLLLARRPPNFSCSPKTRKRTRSSTRSGSTLERVRSARVSAPAG